jgi:FkbM family methyltransferase
MKHQKGIWIPEKDNWEGWAENFESREYKKLGLRGNVCLDIGAHVGIWTKRLSQDFDQVICFEPLQKHIECHRRNCENLSNVILHEYALSNVESESVMSTKDSNSGMSSLLNRRFKGKNEVVVKTKILDSFDLPKIDFMKIDVEGFEKEVLEGGRETIMRDKPIIYVEIWKNKLESTSEFITSLGYSVKEMSSWNYLCEPV